jgi:hypothetical protein
LKQGESVIGINEATVSHIGYAFLLDQMPEARQQLTPYSSYPWVLAARNECRALGGAVPAGCDRWPSSGFTFGLGL